MDEQLRFNARGRRGKRAVYNKHCKEHEISKLGMSMHTGEVPYTSACSTSVLLWTKL